MTETTGGGFRSWRSILWFVVLTYGATWGLLVPVVFSANPSENPLLLAFYVAGAFVPSLVGVIAAWWEGGRRKAVSLLRRVARWRVGARWYLVALCLPVGLKLLVLASLIVVGYPVPTLPDVRAWPVTLTIAVVAGLFPGAVGEELGWRGYALPRLQERYDALVASLILGVVWAVWHLPTFFVEFTGQASLPMGWLLFEIIGASILYTWIVNNAGGSVLLAILFHAANNSLTPIVFPGIVATGYADTFAMTTSLSVWLVAVVVVLVFGRTALSRTRPATTPDT